MKPTFIIGVVLLALGLLGGAYLLYERSQAKKKQNASRRISKKKAPTNVPKGPAAPAPSPLAAGLGNLPSGQDFEEEEMPTVVMAMPAMPELAKAAAKPPTGRTSGATIIAFDDDE